jgi:hypothetical protein
MLEAARARRDEGVDVVLGWVETHGRRETERLTEGLERVPPRDVAYRGLALRELDLDAAFARRHALLIVDELAHTTAPGSRHGRRWQDVEEILDSGIDVYSTLNVQHLESLSDVVSQIAKAPVRETVPDSVFDRADEVELVDLPPDELLQRMRDGKVYVPEQARRAIEAFFQKGNLIALREMSLQRTAERSASTRRCRAGSANRGSRSRGRRASGYSSRWGRRRNRRTSCVPRAAWRPGCARRGSRSRSRRPRYAGCPPRSTTASAHISRSPSASAPRPSLLKPKTRATAFSPWRVNATLRA